MTARLSCDRARSFIEEALDDGLDERRRLDLDAHLQQCPACRRFCESASQVRDLLAEAPAVEPSAIAIRRMRHRLDAELLQRTAAVTPRRALLSLRWTAVAAALLLALGAGSGLLLRERAGGQAGGLSLARGELSQVRPALAALPAEPSPAPRTSSLTVTTLFGESTLRRDGSSGALTPGALVDQGATISTAAGGLLVAAIGDDLRLGLGQGTELRLERLAAGERRLALVSGLIVCDVTPGQGEPRLELSAGGLTIRVVGTVFAVEVDQRRGVEVRVVRGRVLVRDGEAGEVSVDAGRRGLFQPGRAVSGVALRQLGARAGEGDLALLRGEQPRSAPVAAAADVETLFARADEARRRGDVGEALSLYRRIVTLDQGGPSGGTALISLGQLSLGRSPAEARRSFQTYLSRHQRGPMRQEAFEGLLRAEVALGHQEAAQEVARRYLREYRSGRYAARARQVLGAAP